MKKEDPVKKSRPGLVRRLVSVLGPGLVTGAADDDPSGIATYSIAGARLGTSLIWTAWLTWPLMASVQMMCARIGMVGGKGLAGAETFGWRQGLDQKLRNARYFYGIVALSTAAGIALDFADFNPVKALYWSAVVNGLLAPFLLIGILVVACDRQCMHGQPSSLLGRFVVAVTALLMFGAAAGMFFF